MINTLKHYKRTYAYSKAVCKPTFGDASLSFQNALFYFTSRLHPEQADEVHLKAAMAWLSRANDVCNRKGVSATYFLNKGWDVAYPETSGYILATFLTYSELYKDATFFQRAVEIGDWEIEIQTNCGGVLSNPTKSNIRVFNTGQVVLGWCLLYEKTQNKQYLEAAMRSGDFLCNTQESDGRWVQNTYCGARTYHARIAWALLRLFELTKKENYLFAAVKNLKWVLDQQNRNGWFENCGFNDEMPIMHVIVYTLRGLLESHAMNFDKVNELGILPKLLITTERINDFIDSKSRLKPGFIPTSFQNNWLTTDTHSCLTGNAQYAIYLYRLSQLTGDAKYIKYADLLVSSLKKTQKISTNSKEQNVAGAIAGSYPIYTGYCPNAFPNWATKFFADAVMMKNNYKNGLIIKA